MTIYPEDERESRAAIAQKYLKRTDVLDAALQAVTVDRAATHGGARTASTASLRSGRCIWACR